MRIRFASTRVSCRSRLHPRSPRSCWRISCHRRRGRTFFLAPAVCTTSKRRATFQFARMIRAMNFSRNDFFSPPRNFFPARAGELRGDDARAESRQFIRLTRGTRRSTEATTLLDSYVLLEEMLLDGRGAPWVSGEWQQPRRERGALGKKSSLHFQREPPGIS